jgi:probable HAF family extracellular repeat protein
MPSMMAMILLAALPVPAPAASDAASSQPVRYTIFNLGTALGGTSGAATSINDFGFVSGQALTAGSSTVIHAVLWIYGFPFDLRTLGGTSSGQAFAGGVNDRGEVVGISETANLDPNSEPWSCGAFFLQRQIGHACVGFRWRNGVMTALPTLGGPNGFAAGVNNLGQVVGWAENTVHDPTCDPTVPQVLQFKAVVWEPDGRMEQLPGYRGDPDQAAVAINDKGQIVGVSGICGTSVGALSAKHALLWDHGTVTDLGNLEGTGWNTPFAISNNGEVVGFANITSDVNNPIFHAFVWTRSLGRMKDLGTLQGDAISEAESVNDQGQVAGISYGAGFSHPRAVVILQDGIMRDLNGLVLDNLGLALTNAAAINDLGWITGTANDPNGNQVSFLAIPVTR